MQAGMQAGIPKVCYAGAQNVIIAAKTTVLGRAAVEKEVNVKDTEGKRENRTSNANQTEQAKESESDPESER